MYEEKKAFLQRYGDAEQLIERLGDEIARWESRAERVTASYHLAPGGKGDDRIQLAIDEIAELRGELLDQMLYATEVRREIQRVIGAIAEERMQLVLAYRYIDRMRWEEIAERMTVDKRWMMRMHNRALEMMEPMGEKEEAQSLVG